MSRLMHTVIPSPIGPLLITSDGRAIDGLFMSVESRVWPLDPRSIDNPSSAVLQAASNQLGEYFAGTRTTFDLPLRLDGSDFQRAVWSQLLSIPYGATVSYLEIARAIGDAKATRAVGLANGRNPVSIIVPCHRVIGSNGSLTGYGGGIARKRWLLAHETKKRAGAGALTKAWELGV